MIVAVKKKMTLVTIAVVVGEMERMAIKPLSLAWPLMYASATASSRPSPRPSSFQPSGRPTSSFARNVLYPGTKESNNGTITVVIEPPQTQDSLDGGTSNDGRCDAATVRLLVVMNVMVVMKLPRSKLEGDVGTRRCTDMSYS